jgi:ABC-type antimicrobial peptide transport system permease subunit
VGERIKVGPPDFEPWLTVVGVVGDVRNVGLATEPALATYEPHTQRPWSTMSLMIRTDQDPSAVLPSVRAAIHEAGGEVPVFAASTLTERITESLKPRRLILFLMAMFAALALAISAVGVYGVLSYLVSQRTNEFGIRMALGASRGQVTRLVARQGARLVGTGLLLGLIGAALLSETMGSLIHGVNPFDVLTYSAVPVVLALVAAVACYVPARRATGIDPVVALRED